MLTLPAAYIENEFPSQKNFFFLKVITNVQISLDFGSIGFSDLMLQ